MAAGGCDVETATVGDSNIKILGGKEGGAYQTLIEAFSERAAIYTNCDSDSENAECDPQIGNLAIEPITTSGSIENLQHLGMRLVEGSNVSESQHADPQPVDSCRNISENDESCKTFALVQNDVIYRAGQGDLQKVVFDATRSPKVYPSSFAKFDDLRVVLPMYDSFIQVVTAASGERVDNSDSNDCPEPVDQNFRSLCSKKIYLGNLDSVNRNHGMVLLGRHPELQGANKPKFICKNGDRLIDCEQGEVAPGDKWKEILAEKRNKACPLEDRLLANGAVHAYVISGTLKPIVNFQEFLLNAKCYRTNQEGGEQAPGGEDNANSTLPALPDDLKKYRLQLAIPELLIDGILSETETKERNWLLGVFGEQHQQKYPYYRKLESPSNLDGDKFPDQWRNYNFPAPMLAVTTYLVTTESDSDIRGCRHRQALDVNASRSVEQPDALESKTCTDRGESASQARPSTPWSRSGPGRKRIHRSNNPDGVSNCVFFRVPLCAHVFSESQLQSDGRLVSKKGSHILLAKIHRQARPVDSSDDVISWSSSIPGINLCGRCKRQ